MAPRGPRILCYVNHFYGQETRFRGKSTSQEATTRRLIVAAAIEAVRSSGYDVEVRVCGIAGQNLLDVDIDFAHLADPRELVFASIEHMAGRIEDYDYFLNIEDDIQVPAETIANALEFDRSASLTEVLHPNRMETADGQPYCVDLRAMPGWTTSRRGFQGRRLAVAVNPHSGVMLLSRGKFAYARQNVDLAFRGRIVGGLMASAYGNVHAPFALWRSFDDPAFHVVVHLDPWEGAAARAWRPSQRRRRYARLARAIGWRSACC